MCISGPTNVFFNYIKFFLNNLNFIILIEIIPLEFFVFNFKFKYQKKIQNILKWLKEKYHLQLTIMEYFLKLKIYNNSGNAWL